MGGDETEEKLAGQRALVLATNVICSTRFGRSKMHRGTSLVKSSINSVTNYSISLVDEIVSVVISYICSSVECKMGVLFLCFYFIVAARISLKASDFFLEGSICLLEVPIADQLKTKGG